MLVIKSIPAFNDNYIWLIQNNDQQAAVVDPGEAAPVLDYIRQHGLTLETVLITHHHADHTGGISELLRHNPKLNIVGPANDPVPALTHSVSGGEQFELFGETFVVLDLPGHTLGHIGYAGAGKLFCGDTLFSAGCGRIFEGTPQQMFDSLNKIAALPENTDIYPAHEYTAANITFALAVEPDNRHLLDYREQVNRLRADNQPTLPTRLSQEKQVNPFLRTDEESIIRSVANRTFDTSSIAVFTALRQWKDNF